MMEEHKLVKFDAPRNYPKEMITLDCKLTPIKLLFTLLKTAITLASKNHLDGKWSESNVQAYISSYCINTIGHNALVEHCNNTNALNFVNGGGGGGMC